MLKRPKYPTQIVAHVELGVFLKFFKGASEGADP